MALRRTQNAPIEKGKMQISTSHSKQWPYPRHIILTLGKFSPPEAPSRHSQLSAAAGRRQGCTNSFSSKASLCWDTFLFLISLSADSSLIISSDHISLLADLFLIFFFIFFSSVLMVFFSYWFSLYFTLLLIFFSLLWCDAHSRD